MWWTILAALGAVASVAFGALVYLEVTEPEDDDEATARRLTELAHWQRNRGPQRLPGAPLRQRGRWS